LRNCARIGGHGVHQQARHAVLRIRCQVEGGSTYHPRHSKRRRNGRRRKPICHLQSNQKWTAPGLQTEWWQLRNLSHGLRSATAPFVPFSSSRSWQWPDAASKRLELLREVVTSSRRLAIMVNVGFPDAVLDASEAQAAAASKNPLRGVAIAFSYSCYLAPRVPWATPTIGVCGLGGAPR
jgi:hypothetical protein